MSTRAAIVMEPLAFRLNSDGYPSYVLDELLSLHNCLEIADIADGVEYSPPSWEVEWEYRISRDRKIKVYNWGELVAEVDMKNRTIKVLNPEIKEEFEELPCFTVVSEEK